MLRGPFGGPAESFALITVDTSCLLTLQRIPLGSVRLFKEITVHNYYNFDKITGVKNFFLLSEFLSISYLSVSFCFFFKKTSQSTFIVLLN